MATLDELRGKFDVGETERRELERRTVNGKDEKAAHGQLKKGMCPACGQAPFKKLRCTRCHFQASPEAQAETDSTIQLVAIAKEAVAFKTAPPPAEPEAEPEPEPFSYTEKDADREHGGIDFKKLMDKPPMTEEDFDRAFREAERAEAAPSVVAEIEDRGGRFTIEKREGAKKDAILQFGTFKGHRISAMMTQPRSCDYLRWILTEEFSPQLKQIIRDQLGLPSEED